MTGETLDTAAGIVLGRRDVIAHRSAVSELVVHDGPSWAILAATVEILNVAERRGDDVTIIDVAFDAAADIARIRLERRPQTATSPLPPLDVYSLTVAAVTRRPVTTAHDTVLTEDR